MFSARLQKKPAATGDVAMCGSQWSVVKVVSLLGDIEQNEKPRESMETAVSSPLSPLLAGQFNSSDLFYFAITSL